MIDVNFMYIDCLGLDNLIHICFFIKHTAYALYSGLTTYQLHTLFKTLEFIISNFALMWFAMKNCVICLLIFLYPRILQFLTDTSWVCRPLDTGIIMKFCLQAMCKQQIDLLTAQAWFLESKHLVEKVCSYWH